MKSCIVQLGRYGDILNILPVARKISQIEGAAVSFLVHRDYLDLLDGVSYVEPIPWDGNQMRPNEAADSVAGRFDNVLVTQAEDNGRERERICEAYNMEQWRYAGFLSHWTDLEFRLVIDRRSADREDRLISSLDLAGKQFLLFSGHGISSPFPYSDRLLSEIRQHFRASVEVVDMRTFRAEKFHDLLGLLDRAIALITIDTAPLHLAAASPVPVVALISDIENRLWLGTKPRCNTVLTMRYREYPFRRPEILFVIQRIVEAWKNST